MLRLLGILEASFNILILALAVVVAASIGLITVLIPLNLVLIKTGMGGIWWLYEGVEYALYVGVFLGAPWVLHHGAHVRVDVVTSFLPTRWARKLDLLVDGLGVAICVFLCVYGVRASLEEYDFGTLPDKDLRIANWIMLAVFSAAFLMLAIEFLFRMKRLWAGASSGDGVSERGGF